MNLPAPLTGMVGRDRELSELGELLGRARLVTLTGAAGVGKTRLALAAAAECGEAFADGTVFVDLASTLHREAVVLTIARALGLRDDGDLPLVQQLANALRDRESLLLLDNFEQVLAAAPLIPELLQAAPGLTALVTSRAPLRVRGEREFPVAPLECPIPDANESVEALLQYPALMLFVQRAQDVRPDFDLTAANAAAIAATCRHLDGLPLALELAAVRVRVLSPAALLSQLSYGLALLSIGARDLPARQRTLRATMMWSYNLLTPAEQAVFRRLAVFAGDFSLDAATAVAAPATGNLEPRQEGDSGAIPSSAATALDLLTSLVEKNLLRQGEGSEREPRFRLLETVREFAREQLEAHGEADAARRAYAAFFVDFVEDAGPQLRRASREPWLRRVDADMDNLRAIVDWSSAGVDDGEALIRIVNALAFFYWRIRGHLHEGWRWSESALAMPKAQPPSVLRMKLLWAAGALAAYMLRLPLARQWLDESARLARTSDDSTMLGLSLVFLGWVESNQGEQAAARHVEEALTGLRAAGDPVDLLLALNVAILPYELLGDLAAARGVLAESLATAQELGDDWALALALSDAGYLDLVERRWSSAGIHLEQSLALHRRLGDEGSVAYDLKNLSLVARHQGDDDRAVALLEQSLAMQRRLGLPASITLYYLGDWALRRRETPRAMSCLTEALVVGMGSGKQEAIVLILAGLARLAVDVGQPEVAAWLIGGGDALRQRAGVTISLEDWRELDQAVEDVRSMLGEPAFRVAMARGETTPIAQLTAETLAWAQSVPVQELESGAAISRRTLGPTFPGGLSTREIEVLRLIALGNSNQEIASSLRISLNTVARHVSNIFDKVGAANRTEAAAYAYRHGIAR